MDTYMERTPIDFGLISLFNGISTFVGYSMPKSSLLKDKGTIQHIAEE